MNAFSSSSCEGSCSSRWRAARSARENSCPRGTARSSSCPRRSQRRASSPSAPARVAVPPSEGRYAWRGRPASKGEPLAKFCFYFLIPKNEELMTSPVLGGWRFLLVEARGEGGFCLWGGTCSARERLRPCPLLFVARDRLGFGRRSSRSRDKGSARKSTGGIGERQRKAWAQEGRRQLRLEGAFSGKACQPLGNATCFGTESPDRTVA